MPLPVVAPTDEEIASIVGHSGRSCLHVFSGIRWYRTLTTALRFVRQLGLPFAIMSEPRDHAGLAGALRFAQSWATEGGAAPSCAVCAGDRTPWPNLVSLGRLSA